MFPPEISPPPEVTIHRGPIVLSSGRASNAFFSSAKALESDCDPARVLLSLRALQNTMQLPDGWARALLVCQN
jgi:hypothetical protein